MRLKQNYHTIFGIGWTPSFLTMPQKKRLYKGDFSQTGQYVPKPFKLYTNTILKFALYIAIDVGESNGGLSLLYGMARNTWHGMAGNTEEQHINNEQQLPLIHKF